MQSIQFNNVSFNYQEPYQEVFKHFSLSVHTHWRTGLVGDNGCGKTTLLNLIRGKIQPMEGSVDRTEEVLYFPFSPQDPKASTIKVIKDSIAPFEKWEKLLGNPTEENLVLYGEILEKYQEKRGYEINALIEREAQGMGLEESHLLRPFCTLSGGEQTRALIISLFLNPGKFRLIDEPTNHLDIHGREALGQYLSKKQGFIVVSHDRYFLDLCVDHILHVENSRVRITKGDFTQWKVQMDLEEAHKKQRTENLKREVKSLKAAALKRRGWSDRKEKMKQGAFDKGRIGHLAAKSMKRALGVERRIQSKLEEKKELLGIVKRNHDLKIHAPKDLKEQLLTLENLNVSIGNQRILRDFSLHLIRGDRIAILGENGSGKTTLFQCILGRIKPDSGRVRFTHGLKISTAFQHPQWTKGLLRDRLKEAGLDEGRFRQVMGAMDMGGELFDRPLETFSLGQLKKADLCRSFLSPAHLLLWDEPLNDIDLKSRTRIEKVIEKHNPTMLFIEHDRRFIEKTATRVVELKKQD